MLVVVLVQPVTRACELVGSSYLNPAVLFNQFKIFFRYRNCDRKSAK